MVWLRETIPSHRHRTTYHPLNPRRRPTVPSTYIYPSQLHVGRVRPNALAIVRRIPYISAIFSMSDVFIQVIIYDRIVLRSAQLTLFLSFESQTVKFFERANIKRIKTKVPYYLE